MASQPVVTHTLAGNWSGAAYVQAAKAFKEEPDNRPEGITVPSSEGWCAYCNTYKKMVNFKKCARCKVTVYCHSMCQKSDWPVHKANCVSPSSLHAITIKLAERAIGTPHLWIYFDIFAVLSLDLLKTPQNARNHAIDVSFVLVPTNNENCPKEVILQVKSIIPRPLSDIPSGKEIFAPGPDNNGLPPDMICHNIYIQDGNPALRGSLRTLQISRGLPPALIRGMISRNPADPWLPINRFGIRQVIPLNKEALISCVNDAIKGDKENHLRLRTVSTS